MPRAVIKLAHESPMPIYRQIVDQLRSFIENGVLAPGDPLPSVRSLATQLGIHFNTAADAYRELAQEGSIDLSHGKRAVVGSSGSTTRASPAEARSLRLRLRHLVAEMRLKGISGSVIKADVEALVGR